MARIKNLQELFLQAGAKYGKKPMFRHIIAGRVREYQYEDLAPLSYQFAKALHAKGLRAGDYVAIWAENGPNWVLSVLAAFRIGAIVVPLDARSRASEVLPVIEKVEPKLVITGDKQFVRLGDLVPSEKLVLLDGLEGAEDLPDLPHLVSPALDSPALVVFTSGTSGASKGVVLTHGNIISNVTTVIANFNVTKDDRFLSVLPLSHMFEFTAGLSGPIYAGATISYAQLKGASHLQQLLKEEKISVFVATPLVFQSMLKEVEAKIEKLPRGLQIAFALVRNTKFLNSKFRKSFFKHLHKKLGGDIKFWISGGAATPQEVIDAFKSFGITILTGYGMTEASPIVSANNKNQSKANSAGKPLKGVQIKIDTPDEKGTGEICVRGPNVMTGYWNNPEETAKTIKNGWLHTGDSGHIDKDGHVFITGRMKSMIVTAGGYNIYPEELEEALLKSSLIKEVCVFGKMTAAGEAPYAVVVPVDSVLAKPDTEQRIHLEVATCLNNLADYKRLAGYQIWETDLPRTPIGKIKRGEVARIYELKESANADQSPTLKAFEWDEDGVAVCRAVAKLMDPELLRGISPSGSNNFLPTANLAADLGIDSFSRLELLTLFEEEFGLSILEDQLQDVQSLEDLVILVKTAKQPHRQSAKTISTSTDSDDEEETSNTRPWPPSREEAKIWPMRDIAPFIELRRAGSIGLQNFVKAFNQFQAEGTDRLTIDPPYIVAANHTSHYDTIALLASFPANLIKLVHPVAAADYFFSSPLRAAFSSYILNAVPMDRYGNFEENLNYCEDLLRLGKILIIFPEGGRFPKEKPGNFKPGIARLAISVGCPIIPAYIDGGQNVLPKGTAMPKPEHLKVTFGLPLYPPAGEPDLRKCQEFTNQLKTAIMSLGQPSTAAEQHRSSAEENDKEKEATAE